MTENTWSEDGKVTSSHLDCIWNVVDLLGAFYGKMDLTSGLSFATTNGLIPLPKSTGLRGWTTMIGCKKKGKEVAEEDMVNRQTLSDLNFPRFACAGRTSHKAQWTHYKLPSHAPIFKEWLISRPLALLDRVLYTGESMNEQAGNILHRRKANEWGDTFPPRHLGSAKIGRLNVRNASASAYTFGYRLPFSIHEDDGQLPAKKSSERLRDLPQGQPISRSQSQKARSPHPRPSKKSELRITQDDAAPSVCTSWSGVSSAPSEPFPSFSYPTTGISTSTSGYGSDAASAIYGKSSTKKAFIETLFQRIFILFIVDFPPPSRGEENRCILNKEFLRNHGLLHLTSTGNPVQRKGFGHRTYNTSSKPRCHPEQGHGQVLQNIPEESRDHSKSSTRGGPEMYPQLESRPPLAPNPRVPSDDRRAHHPLIPLSGVPVMGVHHSQPRPSQGFEPTLEQPTLDLQQQEHPSIMPSTTGMPRFQVAHNHMPKKLAMPTPLLWAAKPSRSPRYSPSPPNFAPARIGLRDPRNDPAFSAGRMLKNRSNYVPSPPPAEWCLPQRCSHLLPSCYPAHATCYQRETIVTVEDGRPDIGKEFFWKERTKSGQCYIFLSSSKGSGMLDATRNRVF
ncbi:hypothetical protein DFP72DRAFT_1045319 [Ephemerocybe angulata]|uniref:Uncharacterized protein n=1 Tax=Ephemerocybe angulata TaxID=980116 RepID=A0A8H6I132_9AGAR|nr:hypothetical protein DFP72DRAFT_1045319 [Tulosesus angulatus]